jgi:DNA-binding LacI/PurR family transcriptional regulator
MSNAKLQPFSHRTKTQALTSYLTDLAHQLGPETRMPTMQQLCDDLQVSVVTLNRALSELEAQNIITRKHGVGIFVSPRLQQKTIGLVYDRDILQPGTSPFAAMLVEEARRRADAGHEEFSVFLAVPSRDGAPVHHDLVEAIHAHRLHGIIFIGEQNPQAAAWLEKQNLPLVALAYTPLTRWRVKIEHAETARIGVRALAAQGCKRLALLMPLGCGIGRAPGEKSFPELDAFKAALKKAGLPFEAALVWQNEALRSDAACTESNQEQGWRAVADLFSNRDFAPDGLVILDDMMARGALVGLGKLGLRPGEDIKIATHINKGSAALHGYEDDLTLIEIDPAQIVTALFALLEPLMEGQTPSENVVSILPSLKGEQP